MNTNIPGYRGVFLLILAVLLVSMSACEAGGGGGLPTGGTGEGETTEVRIGEGLSNLESYTMNLDITFDTEGEQGSIHMTMSANTTTNDMAVSFSGGGPAFEGISGRKLELYQVDGTGYLLTDGGGTPRCIRSPAGQSVQAAPKMGDMVGDLKGLKLISRGENVNGVMTDHYSLEDVRQAFGQTEIQSISEVKRADVWIAQDGGYPVRIDIEATGENPSGTSGTYTLRYDLTDINQVSTIALPEACENATGIPEMPELP